jgi:hypothetical protein
MRWIRYLLRVILAALVLMDLKLVITVVAPPDDHFFKPTMTGWLLTALTGFLFLCVQGLIVWLDIRIGQSRRRNKPGAVRR